MWANGFLFLDLRGALEKILGVQLYLLLKTVCAIAPTVPTPTTPLRTYLETSAILK